jgi:hypothetical protein
LNVHIDNSKTDDDDDDLIIAVDSTGTKITNRGQWMYDKWGDKTKTRKKKGYLKIHVAVDIKTKEILAFLDVTDEKVHDGKIMPKLIEHVLKRYNKNKKFHIKSVLADGRAYDSNKNFKYLERKKIQPSIKVRKNSIITRKNNMLRNIEVNSQIKDLFKWKKNRGDMDTDGWLMKQHFHL